MKFLPTEFTVKDAKFTVLKLTEDSQKVMANKKGCPTQKLTLKLGVTKPQVYRLFYENLNDNG